MLKGYIIQSFDQLLRPFVGTGIGRYTPFRQLISIYSRISKNEHAFLTRKTVYGFSMELESGKLVDEMIIKTGIWEKGISDLIKKYVKSGDTFVDIGANIGYDSLLASTIVGQEGRVLSFEPSSKNFLRLQKNVVLNGFTNIRLFQTGLGDKKESIIIHYNEFNPGESSLVPGLATTSKPDETVEIDMLDNLIQDGEVDFIKMDIEGYEPRAFAGMKRILQDNKDIKIIFEFSPFLYGSERVIQESSALDFLTSIHSLGFRLYHIHNEENKLEDQEITSLQQYVQGFFVGDSRQSDIFCTRLPIE